MDLKNGRREAVSILVTDQLPKSNDDKVKVSVVESSHLQPPFRAVPQPGGGGNLDLSLDIT